LTATRFSAGSVVMVIGPMVSVVGSSFRRSAIF
jgi:hypothetical protein